MSLCTKLGTSYLSNGRGAQHLRARCAPELVYMGKTKIKCNIVELYIIL